MREFRLKTGEVLTLEALQELYPNVSFAPDFVPPGADLIAESDPPAAGLYERVVRNGVEQVGGQWRQAWKLVPWSEEEVASYKATAQAQAWERIKVERDRRQGSGVLVNGCWFYTDPEDRVRYTAMMVLKLMGLPIPNTPWKTMDGTFCDMTETLALSVFLAVTQLDATLFAKGEAHRAAMMTYADPAAYDFSSGWPASFR